MNKVTLIDYDIGNLLSVKRALSHIGADFSIAKTAADIEAADKLILPGVGAFESCVNELEKRNLSDAIRNAVHKKKLLLGICVGMQMLFDKSEEYGNHNGFGFIEGVVKAIPAVNASGDHTLKIPHMGWTPLRPPQNNNAGWNSPLLKDIPDGADVYFVHSFSAYPAHNKDSIADAQYGGHDICAIANKDNIYGAQFHPEKSGPIGLKILDNFMKL